MEYLEQLAREWYEFQGYFVRTDLWVGLEANGSYDCELDIVAFHPLHRHLVQVEPSFDLLEQTEREDHFRVKFAAGRKYLHRQFGLAADHEIEQVALLADGMSTTPRSIAGGRVLLLSDLLAQILGKLASQDLASALVPEQWPLLRTLHFVSRYPSCYNAIGGNGG